VVVWSVSGSKKFRIEDEAIVKDEVETCPIQFPSRSLSPQPPNLSTS
jgi:hypothetical protein